MKAMQFCVTFALGLLVSAASGSSSTSAAASCSLLEGKAVTLRGRVSKSWDHSFSSDDSEEDALILDPQETVFLLTLKRPLCSAVDGKVKERPVVESRVTILELVLPEGQDWTGFAGHVGHVRTIEGRLNVNVWWHYQASMRLMISDIR